MPGSLSLREIPPRTLAIIGGVVALLVIAGVVYAFTVGSGPDTGGGVAGVASDPSVAGAGPAGVPAPPSAGPTVAGPVGPGAPVADPAQAAPGTAPLPAGASSDLPPRHDMGAGGPAPGSVTISGGAAVPPPGGAFAGQNAGQVGGVEPGTPLKPGDPGWEARSGSDSR